MFLNAVTYDHCNAHFSITVFLCKPMMVGINLVVSLFDLWWKSSRDIPPAWLYTKYFLCFWRNSFELLLSGIYDPSRYFTAENIVETWTLLMLTTDHVVFLWFMWVDKLGTVPILCVEQLVSPLFCMNASHSVIISLWRYGPVWLCPFWDMTVISRQDHTQYVMLWYDKNQVHGFFVLLLCCSFESYRLLWIVEQVDALP